MKTTIYVATHKEYTVQRVPGYVPVQVGAAINEKLPYAGDDTGDNISNKNPYYSELTAMYWAWKNDTDSDIIGTAHYRRYLLDSDKTILSVDRIESILKDYDVIATELNDVGGDGTVLSQYGSLHHGDDLLTVRKILEEKYPDYVEAFDEVMNGDRTHICNILIAKRELFDRYCTWLFGVLSEAEKLIDPSGYDNYNKRVFALMAERLQTVYFRAKALSVCEMMAGCTEEKTETRETREHAESLISRHEYDELLPFLQRAYNDRPDMFLWTSDITGRLSNLLLLGEIYNAEVGAGAKSGCFEGGNLAGELYALLDKLKEIAGADMPDANAIAGVVLEYDLSPVFLMMTVLSDRPQEYLLQAYTGLAESFASMGDNVRTALYAQLAIQFIGNNT